MNLQQAKIILEKINRLYQSMTLDSKIDIHERDLMLSYIRQFHDAFSPGSPALPKEVKARPTRIKESITPPPKPSTSIPVVKPTIAPPSVKIQEPAIKETIKVTPPPPPPAPVKEKVVERPVVKTVTPPPPPPPPPTVSKPTPPRRKKVSEDYDILFEQKEAKELSEKLGEMPIRDLTKAMGLNERILTVNELFNGNNDAFNAALKTLNGYKSFDDAKPFLAEIANDFSWTDKSKKKKAQIFIKLVRRRYK